MEGEEIFGELDIHVPDIFTGMEGKFRAENVRELVGKERRSKPVLQKLAKSRLISYRAKQLEEGAEPTIPRSRIKIFTPEEIAKQELEEKVIPVKIIRKFTDGAYEVWNIKDFRYIVD